MCQRNSSGGWLELLARLRRDMSELETIRTKGKSMSDAWGHLGKPPRSIMNGTASAAKMEQFRDYQDKLKMALAIVNSRKRVARIAELRAQFQRDFPPEE